MSSIIVDDAILNGLRTLFFGDYADEVRSAALKSFSLIQDNIRDSYNNPKARLFELRDEIIENIFKNSLEPFKSEFSFLDADSFDHYHKQVIYQIHDSFARFNYSCLIGACALWFNSFLKYMYFLSNFQYNIENVLDLLHPCLDDLVIKSIIINYGEGDVTIPNWRTISYENYMSLVRLFRKNTSNNAFVYENMIRSQSIYYKNSKIKY